MILGHRPTFQISEEILIGSHSPPPSGRRLRSHKVCTTTFRSEVRLEHAKFSYFFSNVFITKALLKSSASIEDVEFVVDV